jgi:hypothetical protein
VFDYVQSGLLLGNKQDTLSGRGEVGNEVRYRLALTRSRRAVDHSALAREN